jgi:hypothetical protein
MREILVSYPDLIKPEYLTTEKLEYVAALNNTRNFSTSNVHSPAFIPFADMFNHADDWF